MENRPLFAFVALASLALGSSITYGVDHLTSPPPIVITGAVDVPPDPSAITPTTSVGTTSDDASSSVALPSTPRKRKHESGRTGRTPHRKITSGVIHINTASLDELEELPEVGPSTAQAILDFRAQSGGFQSTAELGDIPRMGAKKLARLMPFVAL